jgi:hypothetical protein
MWFANTVVSSWKITIDNTTNADGYIDASRLVVGPYFELAHNPVYGLKLGWKESTQIWETDGGSPRSDAGTPYRLMTFDVQGIPEADRKKWMDIVRYVGMRRDMLVAVMPNGAAAQRRDYAMNCIIQSLPDFNTMHVQGDTSNHSTNMTLREV